MRAYLDVPGQSLVRLDARRTETITQAAERRLAQLPIDDGEAVTAMVLITDDQDIVIDCLEITVP